MKKILLATVALIAVGAAPALAADLPARVYSKAPAVVPVAVFNWTGFYIGGFIGGAGADRNATSTDPRTAAGTFYNGPLVNNYGLSGSVTGGGTIGYNYQPIGSSWLFGIEGEAGYVHVARRIQDINAINAGFAFPDSLDNTRLGDWYGVIAGRLGFTADHVLFYGKGGVAFVNKNYSFADNCSTGGCGTGILNLGNSDNTQVTWAAGAGIEWAFTENWSVKGEYLYLATQQTITSAGVGAGSVAGFSYTNVHTDPGIHTGKIGINYRWGGPAVARY